MVPEVMCAAVSSPDGALVSLARDGDRSAREQLARRVGRSAYVFALQLTGRREAALDVAQDSVLRFFEHLGRFDAARPLDPWLFQIVRNRVRDLMRRERSRQHDSLDALREQRGLEIVDTSADPAADAEQKDLQRRIWLGISQLTDAHREILVLRDYHDLAYREIAEVLAIPKGTVMSRLHAARKNLRQLLVDAGHSSSGGSRSGRDDR